MKPLLVGLAVLAAACGTVTETETGAGAIPAAATSTTVATTSTTVMEVSDSLTITGEGLPRFGEAPDAAVGLEAPTLVGTSFDGSEVRIEPSSRFTVLTFLAHWCPHCRDEVAELGPYFTTNPPPGNVALFAVATGTDETRANYPPSEWLSPATWPIPVLVDTADNQAAAAFGLNAYPFWVVLDPEGVVLARTAGSLPVAAIESLFDNLTALEG